MFIKSYKIKPKTCDNLIKCFYENKNFHTEGTIGFLGVDKKRKDSTDLEIINISNDINLISSGTIYYGDPWRCQRSML